MGKAGPHLMPAAYFILAFLLHIRYAEQHV